MTLTIKSLYDGQLGTSKTALYTTPASTQAIARDISLSNTSGGTVKCNLYFKASGGTSRRITPYDMELQARHSWKYPGVITLEAGDIIEGDAGSGSTVDCVISGVENA